jgi:uncharacterized protein YjbI with pentapeptide repeats
MVNKKQNIGELIESLKSGRIQGTVEITIENNGRINKIFIKKSPKDKEQIEDAISRVRLTNVSLRGADFSEMDLSGSDFSRLNLQGANFSYSKIANADFSGSDMGDANLYKASITQTDLSNSYGIKSLASSYVTGSVNLYNIKPSTDAEITNPYDYGATHQNFMPDDKTDISRLLLAKRGY